MSKTANIAVRVEPSIKQQADIIYNALGITLSDAVNMFLVQTIDNHGLPFTPTLDETSASLARALYEAENHIGKTFDTYAELMEDIYK